MQVIDILGDEPTQYPQFFQRDERIVPWVRFSPGNGVTNFLARAAGSQALFPGFLGILEKALVAIHRRLAVFRPQPAWPTERWDTAFDRDPSASQGSHIFSGKEQLCRLSDSC